LDVIYPVMANVSKKDLGTMLASMDKVQDSQFIQFILILFAGWRPHLLHLFLQLLIPLLGRRQFVLNIVRPVMASISKEDLGTKLALIYKHLVQGPWLPTRSTRATRGRQPLGGLHPSLRREGTRVARTPGQVGSRLEHSCEARSRHFAVPSCLSGHH